MIRKKTFTFKKWLDRQQALAFFCLNLEWKKRNLLVSKSSQTGFLVCSYFSLPEYYFSPSDYLGERSRRKITTKFILYENFFKAIPWYTHYIAKCKSKVLSLKNYNSRQYSYRWFKSYFLFLKVKIWTIMTEIWMINWLINFEYSRCRIFHFSPTVVRII